MCQSKVRAENTTQARPCCDPILDVTLEMLGNLSFTRRNVVNFFIKNLHFSLLKIYFKFTVFYHWRDRQNALQHGLLPSLTCPVAMWKFGPGLVVFLVTPDQEEIEIIVALEIGVQLGIKGERERFVVFTRMNLFLEEM